MIDCIYFSPEIRCYRDGSVERFSWKKWRIVKNTANLKKTYNSIGTDGKHILRHRIIAYCFLGLNIDIETEIIDHIDRNGLNNAVNNLRIVTKQQNGYNRNAKGYYRNKISNKWMAFININGKHTYLGQFDNEEAASKAYQDAKLIHHLI